MDDQIRLEFWKKVGEVNPDVIVPLINPAFVNNLPKWPSLEQSFLTLKKANGNTIIATNGLSSKFDPNLGHQNLNTNGFEVELYIETDEQIDNPQNSYQFDIIYQMALQIANGANIKSMLDKYGVITAELYDVRVPMEFKNSEGRVGVMIGLHSNDVPDTLQLSLSQIRIINVKLLTIKELEYASANGASGREILRDLFSKSSNTVSNLTRESVV